MSEPGPNSSVHVLIAEDSPTQAERLKYILECHEYQVTVTNNGQKALEAARARKPTLIISDILMPEMNGYQLCQAIKSDEQLKRVPVILVTTLGDPQDVIRGLECRADLFILKPYDERYLLSRVQFVLLNHEIRGREQASMGVEVFFNGQRHFISADRLQILNLLLSTYEVAMQRNQELTRAKDALRAANAALQAANKELEAFSYSVSHDLRAPLRRIDTFSKTLVEQCAANLDDRGLDLLQRVRNSCQRMSQLIDDLLGLSRLSYCDLGRETVDLSELAGSILAELHKNQPERQASFSIAPGLSANGDPRLLRIALDNLLGNAWKFTAKCPKAVIEFGAAREGDKQSFFVRDNGAGFDMADAKRLFGAFQRLHAASDFPGTGIGLATVQRIIHRHGGRIWAQSAIEAGTTFNFTLDANASMGEIMG